MAPEINVGAFADVAFLLIIFFILTTTFVKPAGQQLQIPSGTSDPEKKEQQKLTINLTPAEIQFGEKSEPVTLEELRTLLRSERLPQRQPDDRIVIVNSDPKVEYDTYFQVVMAIHDAGGVLGLVEEDEAEGGEP